MPQFPGGFHDLPPNHPTEKRRVLLSAQWHRQALTAACIDCARKAGYAQLELDVVADNASALALYKKFGFVEYGRNSKGFRSRNTGYQERVLMRLAL